jgi:hypothetical protein
MSVVGWLVMDELEIVWNEVVVAVSKCLGGTEENCEGP